MGGWPSVSVSLLRLVPRHCSPRHVSCHAAQVTRTAGVVLPQALSWKLLGRQLYGTPSEATGHLAACHPWRDRPTFKRLAARLGVSPSRLWLIGAEVAAAPSH